LGLLQQRQRRLPWPQRFLAAPTVRFLASKA